MIDPVQLPILLKAIDFVFDEGRKILEERRERRKMDTSTPAEIKAPETEAKEIVPLEPEKAKETEQELSTSKVEENCGKKIKRRSNTWSGCWKHIPAIITLLKEQYAEWGSLLVPPHILHNMTETENSITETRKQLETVLSKVYKKDIQTTE